MMHQVHVGRKKMKFFLEKMRKKKKRKKKRHTQCASGRRRARGKQPIANTFYGWKKIKKKIRGCHIH
jgi:hypothetical protein